MVLEPFTLTCGDGAAAWSTFVPEIVKFKTGYFQDIDCFIFLTATQVCHLDQILDIKFSYNKIIKDIHVIVTSTNVSYEPDLQYIPKLVILSVVSLLQLFHHL